MTSRQSLEQELFDVIIIGGGITGAGIARDASMRGLKILVLEKNDFASGTSSRSGKLIHGGLRYLKYAQLKLVYESCQERYLLWKVLAPHLVKKVKFIYPFYKFSHTPRLLAALGIFIYNILATFKNLGPSKFISKSKLKMLMPDLKDGFIGAISYYDCRANDARLTIDTFKSAAKEGAVLKNYLEVVGISKDENQFNVAVIDHLNDGQEYCFKSQSIINATGIWADQVLNTEKVKKKTSFNLKMSSGIHLTFTKEQFPISEVLTLETPSDHRNIYCVPWGDYVLVGTTDRGYAGSLDSLTIEMEDVDYLLNTLNFYFPKQMLTHQSILSVTFGVRPLIGSSQNKNEKDMSRDYEIVLSNLGIISITGGKLTTYRLMAQKCIDLLISKFFNDKELSACSTKSPISGGQIISSSIEDLADQFAIPCEFVSTLIERYGDNALCILKVGVEVRRIPSLKYFWPEIEYIINNEFVEHLTDLLIRRTDIYLSHPIIENQTLSKIAHFIGDLKGWDERRCADEVEQYLKTVDEMQRYKTIKVS